MAAATFDNYLYKMKDFTLGDTITCVYQYRQVNGFVLTMPKTDFKVLNILMDIKKVEFVNSYQANEIKPAWDFVQVLEPNIFAFRMAPTRMVLCEKVHKHIQKFSK